MDNSENLLRNILFVPRGRRRRSSLENENTFSDEQEVASNTKSRGGLLYPGTKWCGAGNSAADDDDLGKYRVEDKCCRTHDKCDDQLLSGESRNNLTNNSSYVSSSCMCDDKLYECLRQINSQVSNNIGIMYFNILKNPCYALGYPKKCVRYRRYFKEKFCAEYREDQTATKVYLWIKARPYVANAKTTSSA
ncbi:phospholipase A2 [Caerostris extrusa]|uniref:Phospholipase A2 n=1 Tax=Caerostris extrusa TaxID=172846 RepID=A0AAV4T8W8_CAEEX|nr:phospholipase A2 [Caerostris extrusa]